MIAFLVPIFMMLFVGLPALASVLPIVLVEPVWLKLTLIFFAPIVFATTFILVAGVASIPFRRAIVRGKFPRDLSHAVYGPRRLYGLCWTAVYYAGPIYQLALVIPTLKKLMLRLFGYRGSMAVTMYSDTWIRDLPLLDIGKGAYLSNKSTIGTNICLLNGDILVDKITIGEGAMVGHLAMIAPGAVLGARSEVGVGVAFGIRAKLGNDARIGPGCVINHGALIGDKAQIGTMAYIGVAARIGEGVSIPEGAIVPTRAVIETQADVDRLLRRPVEPVQAVAA